MENKPKRLLFHMTVSELQEFWRRAMAANAKNEEERMLILIDMVNDGYKISISETSRTNEQIVEDMSRHYGSILQLESTEIVENPEDEQV